MAIPLRFRHGILRSNNRFLATRISGKSNKLRNRLAPRRQTTTNSEQTAKIGFGVAMHCNEGAGGLPRRLRPEASGEASCAVLVVGKITFPLREDSVLRHGWAWEDFFEARMPERNERSSNPSLVSHLVRDHDHSFGRGLCRQDFVSHSFRSLVELLQPAGKGIGWLKKLETPVMPAVNTNRTIARIMINFVRYVAILNRFVRLAIERIRNFA